MSDTGEHWLLCNASPDLHRQIAANAFLQPTAGVRSTPIAAVMLVDGQIDHSLGLMLLREHGLPLPVWTTPSVHDDLSTGLPILSVLAHYCGIDWHPIDLQGTAWQIPQLPGLALSVIPVDGKPGPYSPYRNAPRRGDNIAVVFKDVQSGRQAFYAPGLAAITPPIRRALEQADCVLLDGSFWADDEMIRAGVSEKRASELGHLPQSGPGGMLDSLRTLPATTRRILIHINNTNPILDENGPERAELTAAGIEVAFDGMEIHL